ncbi:MAG TPA: hypothetical protein VGF76_25180 [Polyangiaceae bacterium]
MLALIDEVLAQGGRFQVSAGALGQAWRDGRRQANLARFTRGTEVEVIPLDDNLSRACGELLAATGTSDVVDASVVLVARSREASIITSDIKDLARLDPKAGLVRI